MDLETFIINDVEYFTTENGIVFDENGTLVGFVGKALLEDAFTKPSQNNFVDILSQKISENPALTKKTRSGSLFVIGGIIGVAVTAACTEDVADVIMEAVHDVSGAEQQASEMKKKLAELKQKKKKQ
ncbi:MAG: hypothetical protein JW995_11485 [Melioribacteraceae bacterium]|nr:hypothetical protein [Melioribacteraceae bacterium]